MVETARRIWTKEKIGRQLAGQSSATSFMSIKDSCNKKITCVDFSFFCLMKYKSSFSLEQNSACSCGQAFIHYCGQ